MSETQIRQESISDTTFLSSTQYRVSLQKHGISGLGGLEASNKTGDKIFEDESLVVSTSVEEDKPSYKCNLQSLVETARGSKSKYQTSQNFN